MIRRVLGIPPEAARLHRDDIAPKLRVTRCIRGVELRADNVQPPAATVIGAVALDGWGLREATSSATTYLSLLIYSVRKTTIKVECFK